LSWHAGNGVKGLLFKAIAQQRQAFPNLAS
jgi:hypothetical protein